PIYAKLQGVINEEVSNAIDKRLNGGGDKDDAGESWNDVIMGYVNDPVKLNSVLPVIQSTIAAIGNLFRPGSAVGMPVALAGTDTPVQRVGALPKNNDEKLQRLAVALDKWERADPDVLDVIEKIVNLAETNQAKYNMAKSLL